MSQSFKGQGTGEREDSQEEKYLLVGKTGLPWMCVCVHAYNQIVYI